MIRNYFKTALRNLMREKSSTVINVLGLTLGITGSLVLFLMVRYMSGFDDFHTKRDRIYRVVSESDGGQGKNYNPGVASVLPDAFRIDFPEAEEVTFTSYRSDALITIPQPQGEPKKFNEEGGVVFAQPNFFKIFDHPLITGDAAKALDEPNEAIISKSLAKKYFGSQDPIGQSVKFDTMEYTIRAVMTDAPATTDFPFTLMLSYVSIKAQHETEGWNSVWSDEQCYFLLKDGEAITKLESRIPAFVDKHLGKENYNHHTYRFQPLHELHFDDRYSTYSQVVVTRERLVALSVIAAFLIITACINFVNLSTAEAIKRSKEVGVRKSLGSSRAQLVAQFLGETTGVTLLSMLVSLALAQITLGFINGFLDLSLVMDLTSDGWLWVYIIGVTLTVSFLSGLYPSLVISGFKPAQALKNQINSRSASGFNLRRGLVVFQFMISQLLIIGTIILLNQMDFFRKQELGYRKDAVLLLPIPEAESPVTGDGSSKMRTLRDQLASLPGIEMASLSSTPPSSGSVNVTGFLMDGESADQQKFTQIKLIDGNYIPLYDITVLAGKALPDLDTATGVMVNEKLATVAGYKNAADMVGKVVNMWGRKLPVLGIVKDFHTVSLHRAIEPTILVNRIRGYETLSLKINPARLQENMEVIKAKWEAAYPEYIFDYRFLDERIREFYEEEEKMSTLLTVFTSIAIFIGCLGLFGLATFMINQKTKEIGVRKVLGASVENIILLFSREYIRLIIFGFVLAAPLAWYLMNLYLSDFAYKITIGPLVFAIGLGITLLIAVVTVGYKSFRAAAVNPVRSLRYE